MAISSSLYLDLVTGRRRGLFSKLALAALSAAAIPYRGLIALRNAYYGAVKRAVRRVDRPVISVGNITVGGTGKTPMAAKIAELLQARGRCVAILSRGYKGRTIPYYEADRQQAAALLSQASDEVLVLRRRCPKALVYLSPDRVSTARQAVADGADCIILDDGFQHRRLARDLDIVLIDATSPLAGVRILPRGLLREPLGSLRRADLIVVTRSDEVSESTKSDIILTIRRHAGSVPTACAVQRISGFVDVKGRPVEGMDAASMQAVIFAGIGNFESFRRSVQRLGVRILAAYEYPDHHYYTADEISGLVEVAATHEANVLLTTEKDTVKLVGRWPEGAGPLVALRLEIEFDDAGGKMVEEAVQRVIEKRN